MKRLMYLNRWGAVLLIGFVASSATLASYSLTAASWPDGSIVMQLQLGSSSALRDGSPSWNVSAEDALATWNQYLSRSSFKVVRDSTAPIGPANGYNNVLFANDVYGSSFGGALAYSTWWYRGNTTVEADVIFNRAYSWNSYRGPYQAPGYDLHRVALHEFGHVLGLHHPDDHGQNVLAIMNSHVSDLDHLAADDIAAGMLLYGSATSTPPPAVTSMPPGIPGNLVASASGATVSLTWLPPASGGSPTSYTIEAGSSSGLTNLANFSTGNTATSFSTSNVAGGAYYVRVRASNAGGASGASNEALLVFGGGCPGAPSTPSGLQGVSVSGTVMLTWNAAPGNPTSYVVEAGSVPGAADQANSDLGSAATSLVANGVSHGVYYTRVRGKNACGVGAPSNEIVVSVP